MYAKGSSLCKLQLASNDTRVALTSPPSSLPTKSEFFRPTFPAEVQPGNVVVHGQPAVVEVTTIENGASRDPHDAARRARLEPHDRSRHRAPHRWSDNGERYRENQAKRWTHARCRRATAVPGATFGYPTAKRGARGAQLTSESLDSHWTEVCDDAGFPSRHWHSGPALRAWSSMTSRRVSGKSPHFSGGRPAALAASMKLRSGAERRALLGK